MLKTFPRILLAALALAILGGSPLRAEEKKEKFTQGKKGQAKEALEESAGKKAKDLTLEASVFGVEVKPHLVHETVRAGDKVGMRHLHAVTVPPGSTVTLELPLEQPKR